ncbi:recQ-mediated genome instability protein 2 [Fukomys damarensis]|uniref:recQ-mediated genome instability protein 2 n=1 Tax=Fukomys damarensis TaxID=885580 RepID=UPI001455C990|nr:recQ-mediated genome instability protein 2 [Fukomys damarensis]
MASATDSCTSGGSAAVRLPRSPPLKNPGPLMYETSALSPSCTTSPGILPSPISFSSQVQLSRGTQGCPRVSLSPRTLPQAFLLFLGKYVMVMGVVQACSPEPCLQAVKMTDLSDNPVHASMWELEVEDLHRSIP